MTARIAAAAVLLMAACGGHPPPQPAAAPAPAGRNDIHWFRSSAEYRGITTEIYRDAGEHLPALIAGMAAGTWAVILDADETVLDNSLNERRLADQHRSFSDTAWSRWVREGAATAIPGAVAFTQRVHALGGRVAIVTNRADSLCGPTRENVKRVGIDADIVLCEVGNETNKNPRFRSIQDGSAGAGAPALTVVEWLGDNIQDFPDLTQAVKDRAGGYADFGVRYFLLPNPMYGSWEHNTEP